MIFLDERRLSRIFDEISKGFVHTPLEIGIYIILILGIIALLLLLYRYQVKKIRKEKTVRALRIYEDIIRKKGLGHQELDILKKLAMYLRDPQEKNLLLENQSTFNTCARKLQNDNRVSTSSLASLRLKLGFKREGPEQIPHSSSELPEDLPLLITQKGKKHCPGRLSKIEPRYLTVTLENGSLPPKPGLPVQVYFQNRSGLFCFTTSIQNYGKGLIMVSHSENIKRLQRRKFYRKTIMLPVYIKLTGSQEPPIRSAIIDLGGGGASVSNPGRQFVPEDDIEISFSTPGKNRINLKASVVRLSNEGKTMHITFSPMPDSTRDLIIRFLFRYKPR